MASSLIFNGRPRCQFGARSARYDYRLSRLTGSSGCDVFVHRSRRIIRIVKRYFSRAIPRFFLFLFFFSFIRTSVWYRFWRIDAGTANFVSIVRVHARPCVCSKCSWNVGERWLWTENELETVANTPLVWLLCVCVNALNFAWAFVLSLRQDFSWFSGRFCHDNSV